MERKAHSLVGACARLLPVFKVFFQHFRRVPGIGFCLTWFGGHTRGAVGGRRSVEGSAGAVPASPGTRSTLHLESLARGVGSLGHTVVLGHRHEGLLGGAYPAKRGGQLRVFPTVPPLDELGGVALGGPFRGWTGGLECVTDRCLGAALPPGRDRGGARCWTYPAFVEGVTLTDSGSADHLLSNSSGDRYPRAECRRLRL